MIIYLAMVPMWSRTARFAHVYAFATLDFVAIILWLSAWASMASYVASGKDHGKNTSKSGCENFKYGSPGRCKLSTGTTLLGVVIMLLFVATFFLSFKAMMRYKRTGMMPASKEHNFAAQTQNAFNPNLHGDDFEDESGMDARQGAYASYKPYQQDEQYAPVYQHDHDGLDHMQAQQPVSPLAMPSPMAGSGLYNQDTSYFGGHHPSEQTVISPDEDMPYARGVYGR